MRGIKMAGAAFFVLAAIYYVMVVSLGLLVHPAQSDIAVVLGNEVLKNGTPSDRLAARVDCALKLYRNKQVSRILVSGGIGLSGFDEATVMAQRLTSNGVPASDIIIDSQGINTMATAINTQKFMQQNHLTNAIIVTQYFHIPRTQLAFRMAGILNATSDYPVFFELSDVPSTLREMVAIPVYWVRYSGLFN